MDKQGQNPLTWFYRSSSVDYIQEVDRNLVGMRDGPTH